MHSNTNFKTTPIGVQKYCKIGFNRLRIFMETIKNKFHPKLSGKNSLSTNKIKCLSPPSNAKLISFDTKNRISYPL